MVILQYIDKYSIMILLDFYLGRSSLMILEETA